MHEPRLRSARLLLAGVVAIGTVAAGAVTAPARAVGTLGPLETVSTAVDSSNAAAWWTPIARYGDYTFLAYDTNIVGDPGSHNVWVARRNPDGTFLRGCVKSTPTSACAIFGDDTGHRDPSLAVDGQGYVHVFTAMHMQDWIYYRSANPLDPRTFLGASGSMPDPGGRFTYPGLTRDGHGDLWMIARAQHDGTSQAGRLYHWSVSSHVWTRATTFAWQENRTVYPDQVTNTPDGDIHITYEWCYAMTGGLRHQASYLRYHPSTGTLYTADGTALGGPATTTTPNAVYRPLAAGEDGSGDATTTGIGLQSAKIALHPTGSGYVPVAIYRYRTTATGNFQVFRATWDGSGWSRALVYGGEYNTTAALAITDDGTTKRIYYVKEDTLETNDLWVSESVNGGPFADRGLEPGLPIRRISVIPTTGGTDVLYLTNANGPNGAPPRNLYYTTLTR